MKFSLKADITYSCSIVMFNCSSFIKNLKYSFFQFRFNQSDHFKLKYWRKLRIWGNCHLENCWRNPGPSKAISMYMYLMMAIEIMFICVLTLAAHVLCINLQAKAIAIKQNYSVTSTLINILLKMLAIPVCFSMTGIKDCRMCKYSFT